ncbi:MAG: chromosome partitioning protein ParA [Parvibaculum sp.]|jgi:chromosome partitioning protein|nr:chromosome partitioning protein ParA [Parvibaculum sp.]
MAIFTFANTKGGAGKTTAVALLASGLARRGLKVEVIDADPQRWISRWVEALTEPFPNLKVQSFATHTNIKARMQAAAARADHVIVDLPGAASRCMAICVSASDHVIIPVQGCAMDAHGGAQVLELIAYLKEKADITVPHAVMLSRVNPLVSTRALNAVRTMLESRGVTLLDVSLVERAAFREMFDYAAPVDRLNPARVSNLVKAQTNAENFVDACLALTRPKNASASALCAA